jgi:hypothetical protein
MLIYKTTINSYSYSKKICKLRIHQNIHPNYKNHYVVRNQKVKLNVIISSSQKLFKFYKFYKANFFKYLL